MLYQNDLHLNPTLHLTSKNWIEIPVPEDIGHALVQIRTTGPGGDGIPAEVHIVRNGGAAPALPLSPREDQGPPRCLRGSFPPRTTPISTRKGKWKAGRNQVQSSPRIARHHLSTHPANHPRGPGKGAGCRGRLKTNQQKQRVYKTL